MRGGLVVGAGWPVATLPMKLTVAMQSDAEAAVRVLLEHWSDDPPRAFTNAVRCAGDGAVIR